MKQSNSNSTNTDIDFLDVSLGAVPSAKALKSRILSETKGMEQLSVEPDSRNANVTFLKSMFKSKYTSSVALAASVALMAVLLLPSTLQQDLGTQQENNFVLDDLNFDEAMLLHDELMFAQL